MRAVTIILANSKFISVFFLKLKIHKAEMANFVTFFVYVLLLCEKNLKIRIGNSLKNLIFLLFLKKGQKLEFKKKKFN